VGGDWSVGDNVFMIVEVVETNKDTGFNLAKMPGVVVEEEDGMHVEWGSIYTANPPDFAFGENEGTVYKEYPGAALTQHAFNLAIPGLGTWLILMASWLFALSTIISWNYYGEQGVIYLFGEKLVFPYRVVYCLLIIVATGPFIQTDADLDSLTALGTGVMLWANIPIMLVFGTVAMGAYHKYGKRLKAGEFHPHKAPPITDVVEGHDHDKPEG